MKSTIKVWSGLGLATALLGAGLSGCADETGDAGETSTAAAQAGEGGEGDGGEGEGGEGEAGAGDGEGGVVISDAATDPIVYGSALAIVEAHAVAALDAYKAGQTDAAGEMFGHPVSEVLADMTPVFEDLGVADFSSTLSDASKAALNGESVEVVEKRYDAIIAALRGAASKAPQSDLSVGAIAAGITADQIERATDMYKTAAGSDIYPPYLDGYGFYKAAVGVFDRNGTAIKTYNSGLHADIGAAITQLAAAYPGAERPEKLDADQSKMLAASSKVNLGLPST
ncbi:MAG: hypothetical protein WBA51_00955 [Erythrobacter sp.]